jgi:hypothetical protein
MILFNGQIDILSFIGFLGFPINRKLCLLFLVDGKKKWVEYNTEILKTQKKRASTLRYINSSLLKGFKRFLTSGLYGLSLEARQLDGLWFMTTRLLKQIFKAKNNIWSSGNFCIKP